MKTTVIIIGAFHCDEKIAYLLRTIRQSLADIDNLLFIKEITLDQFLNMEELFQSSNHVILAATRHDFLLVSKMVATLLDDHLVAKDNMLIPSKSTLYEQGSYLVSWNQTLINALFIETSTPIPPLLISDESTQAHIHLLGIDTDSATLLLSTLAQTHDVELSSFSHIGGWSVLVAQSKKYRSLTPFLEETQTYFHQKAIYAKNIVAHLVERLRQHDKKISCAESCTGGRLASLFTAISGSSDVFDGSLVTYANSLKQEWLGVDHDTLDVYGAVSEKTVLEMLDGVLTTTHANYALAISGIAGPLGGTPTKPVGTVFVGYKSTESQPRVERLLLKGDREYIQMSATYHALRLFFEENREIL